jgi:hypothetical protein
MSISLLSYGEGTSLTTIQELFSRNANSSHRGTRFTLSRDELLTLPEFVLLSLFPNGLLPDGHMGSFHEGDIYPVDVRQVFPPSPLSNC